MHGETNFGFGETCPMTSLLSAHHGLSLLLLRPFDLPSESEIGFTVILNPDSLMERDARYRWVDWTGLYARRWRRRRRWTGAARSWDGRETRWTVPASWRSWRTTRHSPTPRTPWQRPPRTHCRRSLHPAQRIRCSLHSNTDIPWRIFHLF